MTELVNVELAIVHCVAGVLQQSGILKKTRMQYWLNVL